jgi:hypothetical protein
MINLSKLIETINNDKEIDSLTLDEQLDIQTYYYLVEVMDLSNIYPFNATDKFSATFVDDNKIQHFIRIAYQPLNKPRFDVKIGFFDEKGNPVFTRPNLHYNLGPDQKIFNTHIYIFVKKFLEEDNFFEKSKKLESDGKLYLPAIDRSRYRLFRMALNKFLDATKYKMYDDSERNNTLIIEPIKNET